MDLDLKNKEWKEFFLTDVFSEIQRGKRLKKGDHKKGSMPYVSSTSLNNGLDGFVGNEKGVRKFQNCLTIANSGSVGSAFYQPFEFVASDHVTKLKNENYSKYLYQFLGAISKRLGEKYSFNREINDKRIKREKILLPVNKKGEPDFDFMEAFVKQKEQEKFQEYDNYISQRIKSLKDFKPVKPIDAKEFGEFKLHDFFDITKGDQNKMSDLSSGNIPLVSAKNGNNGLKDFVSKNNKKIYLKNTLSLNNDGDGGAGISYYQPFDYLLDSHVTSLKPKKQLSRFPLLFISRCITKQRNKFGHGHSLTNNRLNTFKIMLPINDQNEPDYQYMENYMKQLEFKKLNEYLSEKRKRNQDVPS